MKAVRQARAALKRKHGGVSPSIQYLSIYHNWPGFFGLGALIGPVVAAFVYDDARLDDAVRLCDQGSVYALTGAIFAQDEAAIRELSHKLRFAAGNFYINDKPTGAVVGQQPFGGSRMSGTNDKAGSLWNLIRWVSPRAIKESFVPPRDWRYPFMLSDPT